MLYKFTFYLLTYLQGLLCGHPGFIFQSRSDVVPQSSSAPKAKDATLTLHVKS